MARIKTFEYQESTGRLKEIYDEIIAKRGKLAEVHKIQSLHPESIVKHMDLYLEIMFSRSELSRAEREIQLCEFARKLTEKPDHFNHSESLTGLKEFPLNDSGILDATLVVSYFNFVNRIVMALGVESSAAEIQGYRF